MFLKNKQLTEGVKLNVCKDGNKIKNYSSKDAFRSYKGGVHSSRVCISIDYIICTITV